MSHQCFLAVEPSSSYTLPTKLTILLTHVLYKEYIPKHVVSLDISGKCSPITGKFMLISGNTRKDEVYHSKWSRGAHCEQSRVVTATAPTSHPASTRSEGSPGNPHNNSRAGLRAATLVAHLRKRLKALGWAEVEPLVRGCGWTHRWGWSGQSKPVSAFTPSHLQPCAFLVLKCGKEACSVRCMGD